MADNPSYNGVRSTNSTRTVLRKYPTVPKKEDNKVTTQRPAPSTPSPRGHA